MRAVEIAKTGKGVRTLGVPTVGDRIAQTVAARKLKARVEPIFHADSYGYRPGRSATDAVAACRRRCWLNDWVIGLDIRKFFDTVSWEVLLKAVPAHTEKPWVLLYVERWLKAGHGQPPLQLPDGVFQQIDRGTPQGALCAAAHNPPYEQCWVMRRVCPLGLERRTGSIQRCA
ncbi:reverse transcriptase domain-containing protein [Solwaraspora sp. WMMB335]|uniref:reverse transcriptase domain-containing protein n=1 Tax=Solwaraspora sp. WMMB335 TaxID=3404118 RepID=UPI003B92F6DB